MAPKITPVTLQEMKKKGDKIAVLTCYDASMARLLNAQDIDVILVGDSVGNVKMGHESTLPVTLEDMLLYTKAVKRGNARALLVADMPFLTYEISPKEAVKHAGVLVKSGGAEAVKVEGGDDILPAVEAMIRAKIPVMGHLGLTPQSVLKLGGYKVQGKTPPEADKILEQARRLEQAGVFSIVLEAVPAGLAEKITKTLSIPTVGIGAGAGCDGQVLVLDDMLGLSDGNLPKFVKKYASLRDQAAKAVKEYRDDVKNGRFPQKGNTYE
jgi:3-methyl-2-oxobutanoate hydroxymethyltransferase